MFHRICVLNDFNNRKGVLEYKQYGEVLKIVDAYIVGSEHKGYQSPEDDIGVLLNYKLVMRTKHKDKAWNTVLELLEKLPEYAQDEQHYLYRSIYERKD